ncbi:MAG: hypothetical protein PHR35_17390 [Kiritimatiellae bacterium]|nr:hypothetical protein [Kiritimatiellia bacterium]
MQPRVDNNLVKSMRQQIDTYNDTVDAIICLGHALIWDDGSKTFKKGAGYRLGRRMDTSQHNSVSPNTQVTPDLVVVVTNDYGVIAEAKPSFHGSVGSRQAELKQLMKYDDDLCGWMAPKECVATADIVLMVHYSRKGDTIDILDEAVRTGQLKTSKRLAAVSFARTPQVQEFISLEHFWGSWSDSVIQHRLRPLPVPLERVRPFCTLQLYDSEPPLPLLLQLTWDHVFSRMVPEEKFQDPTSRQFEVVCDVGMVRDQLAETCGQQRSEKRQPEIPRRDWVKKMFDLLVKKRLAEKLNDGDDKYKVFYSRKPDALEYFIKACAVRPVKSGVRGASRKKKQKPHPGQQSMRF